MSTTKQPTLRRPLHPPAAILARPDLRPWGLREWACLIICLPIAAALFVGLCLLVVSAAGYALEWAVRFGWWITGREFRG